MHVNHKLPKNLNFLFKKIIIMGRQQKALKYVMLKDINKKIDFFENKMIQ